MLPRILLACTATLLLLGRRCNAEMVAYLSDARAVSSHQFASDLVFRATADHIGDELEFVEIDLSLSTVSETSLTNFSLVQFDAAFPFSEWQATSFGQNPDSPSRLVMEPFSPPGTDVFSIVDTNPFLIGTLTFDFSSLALSDGDTVRLDITGIDDGTEVRTTAVSLRSAGESTLLDLTYTDPNGGPTTSYTITSIPEPGVLSIGLFFSTGVLLRRRRR